VSLLLKTGLERKEPKRFLSSQCSFHSLFSLLYSPISLEYSGLVQSHKVQGLVLRRHNVGEADRLLVVFTDNMGKWTLRARGVRRPLSKFVGHLEPLMLTNLIFVEGKSGIGTLMSAQVSSTFEGIRSSLTKTTVALHLCEMVDRATVEHNASPTLYSLLVTTLETLERHSALLSVKPAFIIKLLAALGFRLESNQCAQCQEPLERATLGFSAAAGGIVSGECARGAHPLTANDVKYIRALTSMSLDHIHRLRIPTTLVMTTTRLLDDAFSYHTQAEVKSKALYEAFTPRFERI